MRFSLLTLLVFILMLSITKYESEAINDVSFDENYVTIYGDDHLLKLDQGKEIQLAMDLASGSVSISLSLKYSTSLHHIIKF